MEDYAGLFAEVEDPRRGNAKRHALDEILMIALCTVLCGGETCADMALFGRSKRHFLGQFLRLENGIPSHDTFSRLFRLLDPEKFHAWFLAFMQRFAEGCQGVVAIDGKTMRRSFDRASRASPLHLVSAFASDAQLVLGQVAVDKKSNEITAIPQLLDLLTLAGRVVTIDAMGCQRAIAARIIDAKGDYVFGLKGNQGSLRKDVELLFTEQEGCDFKDITVSRHLETDGGHGRIDTRALFATDDIGWLKAQHQWPGLRSIVMILSSRETAKGVEQERRFYISSLPADAEKLAAAIRAHWGIENSLHWVLDVTMNEDSLRSRKDNGPENLGLLRKIALNLARLEPSKGSMRGKLKRAAWEDGFLQSLIAQAVKPQMR